MKIATYLINLDGSHERLASATAQLQRLGLPFERISAVDGRGFDVDNLHIYNKSRALRYMGRSLVGGEIGCYMSHMQCAQALLNSNADIAIVLEDDLHCQANPLPIVQEAVRWLAAHDRADWQVMNIGNPKLKLSSALAPMPSSGGRTVLHAAHYFPITTTGLVWSRSGAAQFLALTQEHGIFAPVDNFLRYWQTRAQQGYSFWPPLLLPSGAESEIDPDAQTALRKKQNRQTHYHLSKQWRLWQDKALALAAKVRRF